MSIAGTYFPPGSSRAFPARLEEDTGRIVIHRPDEASPQSWPWRKIRLSDRVGNIARKLELPDGGLFETTDNEAVDALERRLSGRTAASILHQMERITTWTVLAVILGAACLYGAVVYGIPLSAKVLAESTPRSINVRLAQGTLQILDRQFLQPTTLSSEEQRQARALFAETLKAFPADWRNYRLEFRSGKIIGPNALALPDGTIIMTDEMWRFFRHEDEAAGVFGHEISHVEERHALRALYQASFLAAAMAVIAGDLSQITELAVLLPTVLLQSAYSRGFETEADLASRDVLLRMNRDPVHLANALLRLEQQFCEKIKGKGRQETGQGTKDHPEQPIENKTPPVSSGEKTDKGHRGTQPECNFGGNWLSSHPGAAERARLLGGAKRDTQPHP
jgi:Zn-dependent protease with chaperone function